MAGLKKVCTGCGRNRLLGKFGKQSRMPDGKNPYCRDCMRTYNKRYKSSYKGKVIQEACVRRYKDKNKEDIREYNKLYYIKNRDRILYNKKCRDETECVMIFEEKPSKPTIRKINKSSKLDSIIINPKRKKNG